MEIDKVIKESDDRRLKNKYNSAIYVIRRALALYSVEEMAFSFNGGKDSTVLLHLLRAGYYLHREENGHVNGDLKDFPIRTIYFETSSAFPEINTFTYHTASTYGLQMDIIRTDVKSGLHALLKAQPIKAILLGVRIGDPTAVGQEQFSPSSPGWPPFMRVNPILDWSYRDIWAFLLTCKVSYCSLYDQGYTSIGSIHDTVPNSLLCMSNVSDGAETFRPAYMLSDGRLERAGRVKKVSSSRQCPATANNGFTSADMGRKGTLSAAIIVVGDEILSGIVEDQLGPSLCRKLHSIGWSIHHVAVVRNDIDHVAEEVERRKSTNDMVFLYGGVGPLHSDVSLAGVAKAFGVRLAPDEEFEDSLEHVNNKQSTGTGNEMALLPEGITEFLHHENLPVPLIKCENVIVLSATNVSELDRQWDCLIDISRSSELIQLLEPFAAKSLRINLPDVEFAQPLSKLCLEFPDLSIGCHRESRSGPLVIRIKGKDGSRIDSALEVLRKKFPAETLHGEMDAGYEKPLVSAGGDDTATPLNGRRATNLKVAASDQYMTHIMKNIKSTKSPVIINYGAAWCRVCNQILPAFVRFVDEFPKLSFVYADIDECPETTQHVRYTPTFHFYRDGERVDEMFGAGEERLRDRLWLHS